jgi:hypothetical protein
MTELALFLHHRRQQEERFRSSRHQEQPSFDESAAALRAVLIAAGKFLPTMARVPLHPWVYTRTPWSLSVAHRTDFFWSCHTLWSLGEAPPALERSTGRRRFHRDVDLTLLGQPDDPEAGKEQAAPELPQHGFFGQRRGAGGKDGARLRAGCEAPEGEATIRASW